MPHDIIKKNTHILTSNNTEELLKFYNDIKNVEHIYQNIEGWFDFESTYKEMVGKAFNGSHFVEVGAWLGKSTSYMAVEIAKSRKDIKFDAVDTWEGSPNEPGHQEFIEKLGMSLYDKFLDNMSPVINYVNPVKGLSEEVSKLYDDNSLDFVFLDASHDYESVKKDIDCWFPKVKQNGVIAGHDYNEDGTPGVAWVGVVKAVNEFFGVENITVRKVHAGTWLFRKSIDPDNFTFSYIKGENSVYINSKIDLEADVFIWNYKDIVYDIDASYHCESLFSTKSKFLNKVTNWYHPHKNIFVINNIKIEIKIEGKTICEKYMDFDEERKIYCIGDSHTAIFRKEKYCLTRGLPTPKASHIKNYLHIIDKIIADVDINKDIVLFSFGDTDCRVFVENRLSELEKTPNIDIEKERVKITKNIVNKYFNALNSKYSKYNLIFWSPLASYREDLLYKNKIFDNIDTSILSIDDIKDKISSKWNIKKEFYIPGNHTCVERNLTVEIFNEELKRLCLENNHKFLTMFHDMIDENKLTIYEMTDGSHHLNDNENTLSIIRDKFKNIDNKKEGKEMKILVFSCCFNEEHILPFYLDYYSNFIGADKIIIVDGGSSDRSQDIIKANPKTELIIDIQEKLDDRYLNDIRNNGWKPYREQYDWIIVCDIDEFIYHPNLKEKLKEYDKEGVTIPLTLGYDMIDKKFPKFENGEFITNIIKKGVPDNVFLNKKSIFKSFIDINYHIGAHGCEPIGTVKYSETKDIKHLHYKWLSNKYMTKRSAGVADRLSDWNLSGGCGAHNRPFSLTSISNFNKRCDFQAVQVIGEENKKTPIYAFSHNYLVNNWNDILDNQLRILRESGLYEELTTLFMYVFGDDKEFNRLQKKVNLYDNLFRINIVRIEENFFEYPTLQSLYEFVKMENAYILYFHLKGVWSVYNSAGNSIAIDSWRECLEYFNLEKWRNCVKKLDEGYEVVGSLYNYNEKEPLFSGNFWWANSEYIKKLPKLEYVKENDPDPEDAAKTWCRVECEKWINRIPNKFYNFYIPKDYGFYYIPIDTKDYKEKSYYKISVLIPTYNRFNLLKEAIQSVLDQNYDNFEILVCHDGPSDEYNKFKKDNKHDKIFYYEVPRRNNYGAAQRNFMLEKVTGDYILHLDDDNIIYPDYFDKMIAQIDNKTGMVICRIHYNDKEWTKYVLPLADRIQDCEIDQLGILFKSDIGKMFTWDDYFGHDHRYIKACENVVNSQNLKIKYIPDVLASHRFFGEVIPRIVIVHHCYLRYGWKDILEEQIFLMKNNGLYEGCTEIFATIYADDKNNIKKFRNIIEQEDTLKKWKIIELQQNNYEYDALKHLKKYSEDKHAYICYFHLKGVISKEIDSNIGIPTWRKYLNYFTINKWKDNIENLKDNDIVCVDWNFNDMHQKYVLGGHFFWTKSAYVRTLSEPENNENRFLSEIWITSNPNVKIYENFNYEKIGYKNLYLQWFQPLIYRTNHEEFTNELVSWSFRKYGEQENKYEYKDFIKSLMTNSVNQSVLEISSGYYGSTYCFCNIFDKIVLIDTEETEQIKKLNKEYNNFSFILEDKEAKNKVKGMKFDVLYLRNEYKDCLKEDTSLIFHNFKQKDEEPVVIEPVVEPIEFIKLNTVYIIASHPNYKMSEDITKKTLENIRTFGEKVILSAHCPVSPDIQRLADYFLYDKNNPLIKHDFYTNSWFPHDDYHAHLNITKEDNNFNHALGVFLNYYNSLILAKSQGFNTAVCTNFDMIFSAEDKKVIDNRIYKMRMEGKKAFFMNTPETECVHYKTIFFITDVDYFINTFKYISNEKLYTEEMQKVGSNTNCLENFVYHSLKNKTKDLLLEEINEDKLFPSSRINLFSLIEYNTILPVENEPDKFVIWFSSANSLDSRDFNIAVRKNGNIILTDLKPIDKKFVYYKKVKFTKGDNFEINFRVIDGNEVLRNKIIKVNDEVFNDIKSYGNFIDRKNIENI